MYQSKSRKRSGEFKGKNLYIYRTKNENFYHHVEVTMKKFILWGILIISAASLGLMSFQCSSAEMTSAKLYIQRKEYQNAEAQLLKEVAKNPKNEEAWFMLGQVRIELKDFKGMKDAFVKAKEAGIKYHKEIDGQTLAVWGRLFNEGVENINKAEDAASFDKAIESFNTASYVMPESLVNQQNLGLAYYRKGDFASAIEPLTVAFEKGHSVFACRVLSGIYLQEADKARMTFTETNRDAMELKKNLDMVREKIKGADVKFYLGQPTSVKQETKGKGKSAKVVKEDWTYAPYNLVVTIVDDFVTKVTYTSPFAPKIDSSKLVEARTEYGKAIEVLKK
jgi:tetratricopeptide (TPR) repeat protein